MTGYLVLLCTNLDDFPVRLFKTWRKARRFSKKLKPRRQARKMAELFEVDIAGLICVKIVTFIGGRPLDVDLVRYVDKG